jgi:NAD(P)-dependent dehydrogenase (short-subunit alcohol dehydrogenase family)
MTGERLSGEVALITGSTRGIGLAIARRFAAEGASVVITGRTAAAGEHAAAEIRADGGRATFQRLDVSDESSVDAAMQAATDEFGSLSILVNNAAPMDDVIGPERRDAAVGVLARDAYEEIMAVMLGGVIWSTKHAVTRMAPHGRGAILNIASTSALLGVEDFTCYTAAKGAVCALTRSIAVDYARQRIRCNGLIVGYIMSSDLTAALSMDAAFDRVMRGAHLTRLGRPEDVAAAAAFLVSPEAEFITGTLLTVDGGMTCKMNVLTPKDVDFAAAGAV